MTTTAPSPGEVQRLRVRMGSCGQKLNASQAWKVLRIVGDYDLAVTALLLKPRPKWLFDLVGLGS